MAIERAIKTAQRNKEKPSLILVHTHLGYGSPNKQDTFEAHGSPLGVEEVKLTKENLGWPLEPAFYIPEAVLAHFREAVEQGRQNETKWEQRFSAYAQAYPELAQELHQMMEGELPDGWDLDIPEFSPDAKGMATRVASGKVMNAIASKLPTFIGGSADLDPSTHTALAGEGDFESPQETIDDPQGSVGGGWRYSGKQPPFWCPRTRHGGDPERHGGSRRHNSFWIHFPDLLRLHAASDAPGCLDGIACDLRLYA